MEPTAPLLFFYTHLHDAIRAELDTLAEDVSALETADIGQGGAIDDKISHLRARYRFLEQVYKYHSSVEDEVVYPALDSKVKNVTLAYSVEHEDEEHLLEELLQLLSKAADDAASAPPASPQPNALSSTFNQLARKVAEVHTTLRKHLSKEEQQLLPLLLKEFTYLEQAELVAQFLCCIPLAAVEPVLTWLKRSIPLTEQISLSEQVDAAVQDRLLRQLITSWLRPVDRDIDMTSADANEPTTPDALDSEFVCCGCTRSNSSAHRSSGGGPIIPLQCHRDVEDTVAENDSSATNTSTTTFSRPPLREILYFHQAIRSALASFAEEARALKVAGGDGSTGAAAAAQQLTALVERHRFIRAVCLFHSASEDEIVFPALRRIQEAKLVGENIHQSNSMHQCEHDHINESARFEELGRLLGDVKACVRRGAKEVAALTEALSNVADKLARAMSRHMSKEEAEVLPVLMKSLCAAEQRYMVWRLLRAMPLRLLERVMPWVAGKLREEDVKEWLWNISKAAPKNEAPLVELLTQWALRGDGRKENMHTIGELERGQRPGKGIGGSDDPTFYSTETCGGLSRQIEKERDADKDILVDALPALKRIKTSRTARNSSDIPASTPNDASQPVTTNNNNNPIDHIFQFHKALRRELKDLESAAVELQADADMAHEWPIGGLLTTSIQALQARFQFLRGIYRAHSSAEDEIVFPALEAKETLHNVSHAYTLDHEQEENLFEEIHEVISGIGSCVAGRELDTLRTLASQLSRMCAAVRASLETHVRAEETELWPLFAEHFTIEEQEHLVGVIIGRTGAEVLQVMLSWVKGSMTAEERENMMMSLKSASKSTAFEQWLDAALLVDGTADGGQGTTAITHSPNPQALTWEEEQREVLAEVAKYLAKQGIAGGSTTNVGSQPLPVGKKKGQLENPPASVLPSDAATFRPGWEDIFRMNQKQLEAAVRRVSADASLEPQRKAYLIQHLMASRYIVAQQRRMANSAGATPSMTVTPPSTFFKQQQQSAIASAAQPAPPAQPAAMPPTNVVERPLSYRHYHDSPNNIILGCGHYRRKALLIAPCCGTEHVCRLCHDESTPGHKLDRYAVQEMRCMECGTRQPVAANCSTCHATLARYYCGICHLFDDDPKHEIYHCPFCNFCRRGKGLGVDSFHCMSCNACMSLELFNKHRCTEKALAGTCPVCSDPLFQSSAPIKELPCGHFMHSLCFAAYTRYSYTCPVCSKSLGDMSVYWKMIDTLLKAEALPAEYASRRQTVRCNDCGIETEAPFHFVYHKCNGCGGYNTRVN